MHHTTIIYNFFNLPAKLFCLTIIFFIFVLSNNQFTSADVISINAGGSTNLSVSVDRYIEGFFFGIPEIVAVGCGNGVIESGEQCDDGNTNSGDGCSSSCQTEGVVQPPGGGGGGPGPTVPTVNISITPAQFNINLAVNTTTERIIKVTNLGTSAVTVQVSQADLGSHVILPTGNLTIQSGQTQDLKVVFVALSEPGIFTGKIIIDGREALVSLNVKTKFLLFDSNIVVLNKDFKVVQGKELKTLVTLIPVGEPERLDVTLRFTIKDYKNKVYLTKSETMMVEKQVQLKRNFDTGTLPRGDYIIGLELIYPNGVAPSSAHFTVVEKPKLSLIIIILIILAILIILILIVIILILLLKRRKRREKEGEQEQFEEAI